MNNNKLAKGYDKLSPQERFSLIIAAESRGDEQERAALMDTAPKVGFRVVDYYGLADGFHKLALAHLVDLLSMGNLILWASYLDGDEQTWDLVEELAGAYLAHGEGWRLFCAENNLNPEALLPQGYFGLEVLPMIDKLAKGIYPGEIEPGDYLDTLRSSLGELAGKWD